MANVTLPTPASHLRLRGKGFLAALIVEPGADVQVIQVLPSILLADTPRIAPPRSATAASLQQPTAPGVIAPRRPLGMKLQWDPAAMIGGWSIPGLAPPIEAAGFAIERRIEPSGAWEPVMDADSPAFGGRSDGADGTAAILPGTDLMAAFPEEPQPDAATPDFAFEDLFLTGEDGAGEMTPPTPGTLLRYRLASIDWAGRRGAGVTETAPARLEKHEPPPVPASADPQTADQLDDPGPTGVLATVLVQGGDMSPDEQFVLGDSDNAIVLEWGWRANERETDPFATHFRVYLSSPLDAVPCEIQGVVPVGGRPGAFVATAQLDREIDTGTAKGQYLSAPYPFFVEDHTAGRDISLTLVTRLPGPNGAFNEPAPGLTSLPLNHVARLTRPDAWTERLAPTVPITTEPRYRFIVRDRLTLTQDHPRDALWVGVSAADDEAYVPDSHGGADPRPGNESAIAGLLCQAKWLGRPHYEPPPPAPEVARLTTPEPRGGPVAYRLDLSPWLADAGLSGLMIVERLDAADLLSACAVEGPSLVGTFRGERAPIPIPNPADQQSLVEAVTTGAFEGVADRHLVVLGHPASVPGIPVPPDRLRTLRRHGGRGQPPLRGRALSLPDPPGGCGRTGVGGRVRAAGRDPRAINGARPQPATAPPGAGGRGRRAARRRPERQSLHPLAALRSTPGAGAGPPRPRAQSPRPPAGRPPSAGLRRRHQPGAPGGAPCRARGRRLRREPPCRALHAPGWAGAGVGG